MALVPGLSAPFHISFAGRYALRLLCGSTRLALYLPGRWTPYVVIAHMTPDFDCCARCAVTFGLPRLAFTHTHLVLPFLIT